jgi:hypothetical protein
MTTYRKILSAATIILALPLLAYSQNTNSPSQQSVQGSSSTTPGMHEAMRMTKARAELVHTLDAKDDHRGSHVRIKLAQKVELSNGTELPSGTMLIGRVSMDQMQEGGTSRLALRFNEARLKDGTTVPVKATIVGFFGPQATSFEGYPVEAGDQVPNSWNDGTLQVDQIGAVNGVDLHSKIASRNSGVFVSTKKDDIKLDAGSELQLAIGPANQSWGNKNQSM